MTKSDLPTQEANQLEIVKSSRLTKIRSWYGRYERSLSSVSLVGGFLFDALTLKRVDLFWENFWVVAHLIIVGVCIVLVHAIEKGEGDEENPSKTHFWLVNILQFFFGGILSTYLVFYFRSSDITVSWPFLLVLALAFWANEALKRHFVRLAFQIALFFLSIMCFAMYVVPILAHQIGPDIFLLSGVFSLLFIGLFIVLIRLAANKEFEQSKNIVYAAIGVVFAAVNILYFTHFIPPLPLSIKDAGVYYSVNRGPDGNYVFGTEAQSSNNWLTLYPNFNKLPGQPVFVYSAIFSPASFDMDVVHEWQHQDEQTKVWTTESRIDLSILGGRDGGFRTYSEKSNPGVGRWRVNVLTAAGQLIGRIRFNVVLVNKKPDVIKQQSG